MNKRQKMLRTLNLAHLKWDSEPFRLAHHSIFCRYANYTNTVYCSQQWNANNIAAEYNSLLGSLIEMVKNGKIVGNHYYVQRSVHRMEIRWDIEEKRAYITFMLCDPLAELAVANWRKLTKNERVFSRRSE